jgi:hypothetical protein
MSSVIAANCLSTVTACSTPCRTPRTRLQETLLRAWRYRDSVKEGAPLRPWLYRVATNACLESIFVVWFQASSETFQ